MAIERTRTGLLSWRWEFSGWHTVAFLTAYATFWIAVIGAVAAQVLL